MGFRVCGLSCLVASGIFFPVPGIEPIKPMYPALAGGFFTPGQPGKSQQRGKFLRLVGRSQSKSKAWGYPAGSSRFTCSPYLPQERGPWPFVVGEGFNPLWEHFLSYDGAAHIRIMQEVEMTMVLFGGINLGATVLATGVCVKADPWPFPEGNLGLGHRFPPQPTPVEMGWPSLQEQIFWASLVAQWLRVCLPVQGTRARSLIQEDPTCHGQVHLSTTTAEAACSGPCAPQQENHHNERPMHHE